MKAKIDRPKLERSLKRFAKDFGETNAQAVIRWSVQSCRELANETLPWNSMGKARLIHKHAIERDLGRVVFVMETMPKSKRARILKSTSECIEWMDQNRAGNNRTRKLAPEIRKECSRTIYNKTVAQLMKRAGIAKGGWLGAGDDIARAQTGMDRMAIGKNFLSYAKKHRKFGESTKPRWGFSPFALITNTAKHSGTDYVLTNSKKQKAVDWGLKKTLTWYKKAVKRLNQKPA
jgi:hypothetical protein